jgi:hypothetical protein
MKIKGKKRMKERPTAASVENMVAESKSYTALLSGHLKKFAKKR